MITSKHMDTLCAVVTLLALVLTVLFMNGRALGLESVPDGDSESDLFTDNDLDSGWDISDANPIDLTARTASGGAYFAESGLHIVSAGRYVLSGALEGSVTVEARSGDKIWLCLNGVDITSADGPALRVEQAEKVFLTLAEGAENTLRSEAFTDTSDGADGAVYSRDDLTLNGAGALTVESAAHGVVCNDDLVLTGGSVRITAAQDGLHANDSVRIREANIEIDAGDDGVTVSNDLGAGTFTMASGVLRIPSCYEGVEGQQIEVRGGTVEIMPTDDGFNARETDSNILITGGDIRVVNETGRDADGLDSNGSIRIAGGRVFISVSDTGGSAALDAGAETGGTCLVDGGTVIAAGSSAMAEGFDSASAQPFVTAQVRGPAGAAIELLDENGNAILTETVPCSFSSLILSTPDLTLGETVTLSVDGEQTTLTADNQSSASGFVGGRGFMGGRGAMGDMGGRRDFMPQDTAASNTPAPPDAASAPTGAAPPDAAAAPETAVPPDSSSADAAPPTATFPMGGREDTDFQPGDRTRFQDRFSQTASPDTPQTPSSPDRQTVLLTILSALALAAGILIAAKTKHI